MPNISTFGKDFNKILIDRTDTGYRYIGIARCGTAESKPAWQIIKETLDGNGNIIASQTYKDFAAWTDRTTLEY